MTPMAGNRKGQARARRPRAVPSPLPVTRHPSPFTCRSGFTFLEVVVSLAVMSVGIVAVLEAFSAASRLSLQDEYITTATHLAISKMEEVEKETAITAGAQEGDFGDDFPDFRWTLDIEDSPISGLETVTVTVKWEAAGRDDELTLTSALPAQTSEETGGAGTAAAGGGGAP
jgi:prepilin-type N-terminal cleavage/methylation domain-containing protein